MAFATHEIPVLLNLPAHLSSLETLEALVKEPRLSPTFRAGIQREITRAHAARRDHEARRGVCFSGMDADPYAVRPLAEIQAEAARAEAFQNSPRGRFLAALNGVEQLRPAEGDKIRGIWTRELADERKPLNVAAVGSAIVILTEIPGRDARAAVDALAEMLMGTQRKAA